MIPQPPAGIRPPARPASLPAGDIYQVKMTLRGVSKPPVWRRIAVPAGLTLDLLHEVIQQAMGWEHEDLLDWLGLDSAADFDPADFSLDEVNARLSQLT